MASAVHFTTIIPFCIQFHVTFATEFQRKRFFEKYLPHYFIFKYFEVSKKNSKYLLTTI